MKKSFFTLFLVSFLFASTNSKIDSNSSNIDINKTKEENLTKDELIKKALEEQIKREEKYKKEQKFYMGKDYNLDEHKV